MMSVEGPRPSCISSSSCAASASVAPSNSGLLRKLRISPALRANAPLPTGGPPPSIGTTRDFCWQIAGICSGGRSCATAFATAVRAAATDRGTATPLRSVTKVLPSQYQRWSTARPAHHHGRTILAGDGDVAGAGLSAFQQVTKGRDAKMVGGNSVSGRRTARDPLVLDAIDALVAAALREVEPVVGDDPGPRRAGTRHDGRMAWAGLRRIVALVAVAIHGPAAEPADPAEEDPPILVVKIGRQLVDRQRDDQFRRRWSLRGCGGGEQRSSGH